MSLATALANDPYPYYGWLRDNEPVHYEPDLDLWLVTRYDDVAAVVHDPTTFSSERGMGRFFREGLRRGGSEGATLADALVGIRVLIATDPPDHTRLRRIVNRAFTPKAITALEPHIRGLAAHYVDELLDASERGEADLVTHLAIPLPVIVIAELLGIPPERRHDFRRWSNDMVGGLGGQGDLLAAQTSAFELYQYFDEVVTERRDHPREDLVSRIVEREGTEGLSTLDVVSFCVLLLLAGNETTTNLLGNLTAALFEHPDIAEQLWANPALVPAAVEEALRYDAPVQGLFRATTDDATIGGHRLATGQTLMALFASANRDPAHFTDPDRFDLARDGADHLAFGHGIHYCLGASLARLEASAAYDALINRTSRLAPAGPAQRVDSLALRGFTTLPVTATPR